MMGTTEPDAYGPTHNPWDLDRSPGGSSGGSAAAVAARIVPAAHANDIAGSIRIPAAQCGLVGLRADAWPCRRSAPPTTRPSACTPRASITRTMRDTAALLDAIIDASPSGLWPAPPLPRPLAAELGAPPGRLRVGLCVRAFNGAEVDSGCAAAALAAGPLLEELGHAVEEAAPAALFEPDLLAGARTLLGVHAAAELDRWSATLGRPLGEDDVEPLHVAGRRGGRQVRGAEVLRPADPPAASWPAPSRPGGTRPSTCSSHRPRPSQARLLGAYKQGYSPGRASAFTRAFNVTGQPALSLPLGWPDDGLPRGVQLVAGYGREDVLVRVGAQLEAAAPWAHRRPPLLG